MSNQNSNNTAAHALKGEALLLQQLMLGSMDAFTALYNHYQPRLSLFIAPFTRHSPHLANDIIQDVFVKLWTKREDLAGIQILEYYLQRMAKNRLLDDMRLRKTKLRHEGSFAGIQTGRASLTEDQLQLKEYHQLAQEAIRMLPGRRRFIFNLSVLEGHSLDEISGLTGLSKEVVKKQLFKARRFIRERLEKKGGISFRAIFLLF